MLGVYQATGVYKQQVEILPVSLITHEKSSGTRFITNLQRGLWMAVFIIFPWLLEL